MTAENLEAPTSSDQPFIEEGLSPEQYQYLVNPQIAIEHDVAPETLLLPYMAVVTAMRDRVHRAIDGLHGGGSTLDSVASEWARFSKSGKYSGITGVAVPLIASGIIFSVPPLALVAFGTGGLLLAVGHLFDEHFDSAQDRVQRVRDAVGSMMDFLAMVLTFMLRIGHGLKVQVDRFCQQNQTLSETNDAFARQVQHFGNKLTTMHDQISTFSQQRIAYLDTLQQSSQQAATDQQVMTQRYQQHALALEEMVQAVQPLFDTLKARAEDAEAQRASLDKLLMQMMAYQRQQGRLDEQFHDGMRETLGENYDNFTRIAGEFDKSSALLVKATTEVELRNQELARTQQAYQTLHQQYQKLLETHQQLLGEQRTQLDVHRGAADDLKQALEAHRDALASSAVVAEPIPAGRHRSTWHQLLFSGRLLAKPAAVSEPLTTKVTP